MNFYHTNRPQPSPRKPSHIETYDHLFKIILIGDSGVGKSSILLRYLDDKFSENSTCTIGVDFGIKTINIRSKKIKLQIWDTAGQEKYKAITSSYYKGCHGIILVYDVTNITSFSNINNWFNEISDKVSFTLPKILISNKNDLLKNADNQTLVNSVDPLTAQNWASDHSMQFVETSAKDSHNIDQAFSILASIILNTLPVNNKLIENPSPPSIGPTSSLSPTIDPPNTCQC